MKIAICDDIQEELQLNLLYLNEYIKEKNIEAEIVSFSHPDQLLSACEKEGFHLYILDMIMPMMSGVQLGKIIRKFDTEAKIIYITTTPEFALDSFTAQPLSYILKPVDKHKLFHIFDIAAEKIRADLEETITIKTKSAVHTFPISTIAYCEYMNHNVIYTCANGKMLEMSTISGNFANHIEPILKNKCFIKPHVSFVVNMSYVEKQDWFYDDVLYANENNIFSGTSVDTFSPNSAMTRAMYVTVIGRMENIDTGAYSQTSTFNDVEEDSYYASYVEWAKQLGITSGTGNGMFTPNAFITRQDMATFTTRFFDSCGYTYPNTSIATVPKDIALVSEYAKDSVLKLWSAGLLKGDLNGNFNPLNTATRAETAAFCSRIHQNKKISETANKTDDKTTKHFSSSKKYTINFNTNGGGTIANQTLRTGTAMKNLPIPFKENFIFEGWCYDEALSQPISTSDVINNDLTLYAKYIETAPLKEDETPHFASAMDQRSDFTIKIISAISMTAEEVKNGIIAKNLSSIEQSDFITVTGSEKEFTISGKNGFEEGSTFKITLEDENLSFDGFLQTVRDYNFTIKKDEVMNLSLNSAVIYIPANEIDNVTGEGKAPITLNENGISKSEPSGGNFTYSGEKELKPGDEVAIYEGKRPDLRTVGDVDAGDILYAKIVSKAGNTYTYTSVEAEEILFTPDVLPISSEADTDGNPNNNAITVSKDVLDFSQDVYQNIGLDSQTTVDVGDYISFYDGDFGLNMISRGYAKIIEVTNGDNAVVVKFENVTQEEMFAAMDAYDTNQLSGEKMLKNVNKDALEKSVEMQALNSGFAEESAFYLASLALKTDSFTELSSTYD